MASMEFRVLGPVEAVDGDRLLPLGGPKPRALLAHLLLRAGHPTTRQDLIDELWGEQAPRSARDSLNVHAGLLRRALGTRLRTVPSGYLLQAGSDEVDASRFESQVQAVRARPRGPAETSALLGAALDLWRGKPFGGIPVGPTASAAAARLDEVESLLAGYGPLAVTATSERMLVFCEFGDEEAYLRYRLELAERLKLSVQAFQFRRIEKLPVTGSGKTDYGRLPVQP